MKTLLIGGAMALALTSTSLSATPIHAPGGMAAVGTPADGQVWLAKSNKGKGKGNGNAAGNKKKANQAKGNAGNAKAGKGKGNAKAGKGNERAGNAGNGNGNAKNQQAAKQKQKPKANGNGVTRAANGNGNANAAKGRQALAPAERETVVSRILSTPAPDGRDMTRVLAATGLALATPQLAIADIPETELITYSNCPPGLAKKNPPCVPPGLAKNGVTYDEWASYDQDRYDSIWVDRRDAWLGSGFDVDPNPDLLLLQSDQVATLFDLAPAPRGQRYALIDGMPVLLDDDDYRSLLLVNQMARVPDLPAGMPIAPTAALTQSDLINLYRLPQPGADQSYAVLNGQIVQLDNSDYELLQMLRIARAVL
ncbi:hypothetical protein [Roseovarius indicus]|uniref:hypothetical protein n=1 Tax=Roseovarius indicus TaxID=540747 RepID=UPI0032EAA4F0